jgi:hypothetical protein
MGCTNHASPRSIAFHHASMHVAVKEKCILSWITFILSDNHVVPVHLSQSMQAPRFLLRTGLCHMCFLRARCRAKALLSMGASFVLPTRSVSDSLPLFYLQPREAVPDFSSPHVVIAALVFLHLRYYKTKFFCYYDFLDMCVSQVPFASIS